MSEIEEVKHELARLRAREAEDVSNLARTRQAIARAERRLAKLITAGPLLGYAPGTPRAVVRAGGKK